MKKAFWAAVTAGLLLLGAGCVDGAVVSKVNEGAPTSTASVPLNSNILNLSGSELDKVPAYVFSSSELRELDLSNNRLTGALPAEIRQLQKLTVLNASRNQMTGVPAEIGQLGELRVLDLSYNKLTGLPLELGNLKRLQRLDLRGNDVSRQDLEAIRGQLSGTEILE